MLFQTSGNGSVSSIRGFLYRRLCRLITCTFRQGSGTAGGIVPIDSKFSVASFSDAVLHPFYWQVASLLDGPANYIVDCGAHCGHFSLIASICNQRRFGSQPETVVMVEPNPVLAKKLKAFGEQAKLAKSIRVVEAMLSSKDSGEEALYISRKNFLSASSTPVKNARQMKREGMTLDTIAGGTQIDILKLDVEGGEHRMLLGGCDSLDRTKLIFVEVHGSGHEKISFVDALQIRGFAPVGQSYEHCGAQLIAFANSRFQ